LKEWVKDDRITLEANLKYWGSPKPAFTSVTFRPIPEASSRIAALLAGDVDIITDIAPADFARINASGRATAAAIAGGRTAMVKINPRKKPLDDVRVRQALNYAVDKEALIKSLLGGLTTVSPGQILTPIYLGFNPALQAYPYNPAMAKKLLAEAGYPNGFDLEFDVPVGRYLLGEQISQAIAGQLAAVGIRAKISEMAFSAFMDKFVKAQNLAHLGYITYGAASLDADFIFTLFEPGNPYAYWDDAKFAELIRGARAVLNQDKRAELYKQATVVMRDQAPIIFLFPQPFAYAIRNNTVNWKARPDDFVRAMDMEPK
jgi:peptide/nickel transport system substrate-binding protein